MGLAVVKKDFVPVLAVILVVGAILFHEQVLAIFRGMSPLDAMQFIMKFVLHATVVTVLSYIVLSIPKMARPFFRMLRGRHRHRRERYTHQMKTARVKSPHISNEQIIQLLRQHGGRSRPEPIANIQPSHDEKLDF